jgi:hypothetical protein
MRKCGIAPRVAASRKQPGEFPRARGRRIANPHQVEQPASQKIGAARGNRA